MTDFDAALAAMVASLAAQLPGRHVQRSLVDPANETATRLTSGVICLVSEGGGQFANYRGREGELGRLNVRVVGFVQVAEAAEAVAVESAELALLRDVLGWVNAPTVHPGVDFIEPGDFAQSKQLEHPYGWVTLALTVRP